eukprot:1158461-Pelagomonas_calceolata.AAC.1
MPGLFACAGVRLSVDGFVMWCMVLFNESQERRQEAPHQAWLRALRQGYLISELARAPPLGLTGTYRWHRVCGGSGKGGEGAWSAEASQMIRSIEVKGAQTENKLGAVNSSGARRKERIIREVWATKTGRWVTGTFSNLGSHFVDCKPVMGHGRISVHVKAEFVPRRDICID